MTLRDTIASAFKSKIDECGIEVSNTKKGSSFMALFTAGDFMADFTLGDQDTEETIQGVTWCEDCPMTGDVLIIEGKCYIVQTIQSRPNGVVSRFHCNLRHQSWQNH